MCGGAVTLNRTAPPPTTQKAIKQPVSYESIGEADQSWRGGDKESSDTGLVCMLLGTSVNTFHLIVFEPPSLLECYGSAFDCFPPAARTSRPATEAQTESVQAHFTCAGDLRRHSGDWSKFVPYPSCPPGVLWLCVLATITAELKFLPNGASREGTSCGDSCRAYAGWVSILLASLLLSMRDLSMLSQHW